MFKQSFIVPIHKGDSHAEASNYRPVALTSHLCKIFEKILRKHMVHYLESKQCLNPRQHGFRTGRSCISQLLEHFEKLITEVCNGNNADVVYIDFSKAFDKLDFSILMKKLKRFGITGKVGKWIMSFLMGRKQCVIVNGNKSTPTLVLSGVPQGSVLGPLLFILFMTDIDKDVQYSFSSSYADDTRIMNKIANIEDIYHLQNDMNAMYRWSETNNMVLNDLKFELLQYGRDNDLKLLGSYKTPAGLKIDSKSEIKDLGVVMSSDLTFSKHINSVVSSVKDLIAWTLQTFYSRSQICMMTIWQSLILPRLDYGSQLWNPIRKADINALELLQRNFVKRIYGLGYLTYWEQLIELGLYSLQRRRERYLIIYLWKIFENFVPNPKPNQIYVKYDNHRLGRMCFIPTLRNGIYKELQMTSFSYNAAKLFNCLPKYIRDLTGCSKEKFKHTLDYYLKSIPDEPQIPGYTDCRRTDTNSVLDMNCFSNYIMTEH